MLSRNLWMMTPKTQETVAIKAEPSNESKQVLPMEVYVLQSIQGKKHAPEFFGCGTRNGCNYLVLELLSRNLTELRRESPHLRFSLGTCFYLTAHGVEALRDLHTSGFLHRDVKPSNFTLGLKGSKIRTLYLIDYGLARRYVNKKNEVRPPRSKVGFRGTVRYASINTHEGRDMGRHDDLWSLFYSMIEIHKGTLPWRKLPDKEDVARWKRKMTLEQLCQSSPREMLEFGKLIRRLSYHWTPKYDAMISELRKGMRNANFNFKDPLDWEVGFKPVIKEEEERKKGTHYP